LAQPGKILVNSLKGGPILRLLFTFGGKTLQKVTGLIQVVLKEAIIFLGEAQHLPELSKTRFCTNGWKFDLKDRHL
jgi:hypothetical protein